MEDKFSDKYLKMIEQLSHKDLALCDYSSLKNAKSNYKYYKRKENQRIKLNKYFLLGKIYNKIYPEKKQYRTSEFYLMLINTIELANKEYICQNDLNLLCSDQFIRVLANKYYPQEADLQINENIRLEQSDEYTLNHLEDFKKFLSYDLVEEYNHNLTMPLLYKGNNLYDYDYKHI